MPIAPLIRPTLRLPAVYEAVEEHVKTLVRQGTSAKTNYICHLLLGSYLRYRKHGSPESIYKLEASYFKEADLCKRLGGRHSDPKTRFPTYQKYLLPYWDFERGNAGYSVKEGETKRYVLRPDAIALIENALSDDRPAKVINRETGQELHPSDLPANGVYRTSYSTTAVSAIVPFDPSEVAGMIAQAERELLGLTGFDEFRQMLPLRHLRVIRKWIGVWGGLPNLYSDFRDDDPFAGHGRLFGGGAFHLQGMPKSIRRKILPGRGLWDYDFENCNIAILCSLADVVEVEIPAIKEYRDHKQATRKRLAVASGVKVESIKEALLALVYGAKLKAHSATSLGKLLKYAAATRFIALPWVQQFHDEMDLLSDAVLQWSKTPDAPEEWTLDNVANVVGKLLPLHEEVRTKAGRVNVKPVADRNLLNHLVTGYEAWCLNVALEGRSDVTCLIFDGWIGGKVDTGQVSALILDRSTKKLGFPLQMGIEEVAL
jgi:hypothetical protein